jgi:anti-sigma regulatory factor (Ser/Thr protein kinase)
MKLLALWPPTREHPPRPPDPHRTHDGEVLELPAEPLAVVRAREFIREAAIACNLNGSECYRFVYAVNEAVTNAIKHGAPDSRGMITLTVAHDSSVLTVAVRDSGVFGAPSASKRSNIEGGRGFELMLRLTDALHLQREDSGTTVFLSKLLGSNETTTLAQG